MVSAARRPRRTLAGVVVIAVLLAAPVLAGCGSPARQDEGTPDRSAVPVRSTARPQEMKSSPAAVPARPAGLGTIGRYRVGQRQMIFGEPAHTGVTGEYLGERSLVTVIDYPVGQGSGSQLAPGPFPLLMFAPGFLQCASTYEDLLHAWASAGYVVVSVNFPRTSCATGPAAYEPDLVNQPADVSWVLGRLLALNAAPGDFFSGRLDPRRVAAAGQSDGGDTVAALAASTCCRDHQLTAVAVLSGAEWPPMPGTYFTGGAPPMLFAQGSADTINPPWASLQLYRADTAGARYYLDLFGASHMVPYSGDNPVERLVARVTVAFFDRYVLGEASALTTMTRAAASGGIAALDSGGQLPPGTG